MEIYSNNLLCSPITARQRQQQQHQQHHPKAAEKWQKLSALKPPVSPHQPCEVCGHEPVDEWKRLPGTVQLCTNRCSFRR